MRALQSSVIVAILLTATALAARAQTTAPENTMLIYLGTSSGGKDAGIYQTRLDIATATLSQPTLAAKTPRPSFLALHPKLSVLYACSEVNTFDGKKSGGVESFTYDANTGALTPQSRQPSGGMGPCFVEADPLGRFVVVANYSSGSVALLPIDAEGKLSPPSSFVQHNGSGPDPKRQEGPHAHAIRIDPTGKFAFAADLGTDQLFVYKIQGNQLTPAPAPFAKLASGAGPRHLVISKDLIYVVNELGNTITVFAFDPATTALQERQTISTLPIHFKGTSYAAEIAMHPNGRFIYASNRGHNSIAVFPLDPKTRLLQPTTLFPASGGDFPRHFALDPTGKFLISAGQKANRVTVFTVDQISGCPQYTGQNIDVPAPTCVRFVPAANR